MNEKQAERIAAALEKIAAEMHELTKEHGTLDIHADTIAHALENIR